MTTEAKEANSQGKHSFEAMILKTDPSEISRRLNNPQRIVITTHKSPDADALGSSLALCRVLQKAGHKTAVVVPDAFPKFLNWMQGADQVIIHDRQRSQARDAMQTADMLFCLDFNRPERIGEIWKHISRTSVFITLIDHHIDPELDHDFSLCETGASSTCELVFRFMRDLNLMNHLDLDVARCLYAGIMTDTGSFRFSSTSAETHRITAQLMDIGLDSEWVHRAVYDTGHIGRLQLLGYILSEKLEYDPVHGIAIMSLSEEEKDRFNFQKGDSEGFVNYGLQMEGSRMSVFMSQEKDLIKFSFRSKGELDVNAFAVKYFEGGGHRNAAGGKLVGTVHQALARLKQALSKEFQ